MLPIHEQSRCQRPPDMAAFLHQLSGGYADMKKLPPPTHRKRSLGENDAAVAIFSRETWI